MPSPTLSVTVSPQARLSYLALASIGRRAFTKSAPQQNSGKFTRSDFSGQGFTGTYEPGQPTAGPLGGASLIGNSVIWPRALKQHLDQYVVQQDKAKKQLSSNVFHHDIRRREAQRQEDAQAEREAQALRREMSQRHPVEDEYIGQQQTVVYPPPSQSEPQEPPPSSTVEPQPIEEDSSPANIEKSNLLILGPSGVGKTLMVKTLAKKLGVPFAASNCTSFTQAGYIGEDAEVCVHHLLRAANYDVRAAEHGIIFLDEIDKIATTKMAHGKDVGGEGVQQALLGLLEGTTVQVQPKPERGSGRSPNSSQNNISGFPSHNPLDGSRNPGMSGTTSPPSGKGEVYNVRTDNILFIVAGAFPGLEKKVMDRVSARGIGFGAAVRSSKSDGKHETLLSGDEALFKKHLPFYIPPPPPNPVYGAQQPKPTEQSYNILDLVEPADLQNYGMIPELLGRIPIICAVSSLSVEDLVRVLTEPKNSLLEQYERKFRLASGIELRFTNGALHEVAKKASNMSTGARGLRTVMERLLSEAMYETPGSTVKFVLITQDVAQLKCAPLYFERHQATNFHATLQREEERWDEELRLKEGAGAVHTFQEYRKQGAGAG